MFPGCISQKPAKSHKSRITIKSKSPFYSFWFCHEFEVPLYPQISSPDECNILLSYFWLFWHKLHMSRSWKQNITRRISVENFLYFWNVINNPSSSLWETRVAASPFTQIRSIPDDNKPFSRVRLQRQLDVSTRLIQRRFTHEKGDSKSNIEEKSVKKANLVTD